LRPILLEVLDMVYSRHDFLSPFLCPNRPQMLCFLFEMVRYDSVKLRAVNVEIGHLIVNGDIA